MKDWAIQIINDYGYWGILMLTTLESIFPIIPAEIILTLSGFMTSYTGMTRFGVILYATAGELLGALTLYSIGRYFKLEKMERFTNLKILRMIGIKKDDIYKTKEWFVKKGKYTVLFGRCIPVLGSLISVPAGMAQMNIFTFVGFTLIGISVWNTVLVSLGYAARASWEIIAHGADTVSTIVAYVFVIGIVMNVFLFYKRHAKN